MITVDSVEGQHILKLHKEGYGSRYIAEVVLGRASKKSTVNDFLERSRGIEQQEKSKRHLPRVLILDLETVPIIGAVWGLWNNNLSLDMIESEWFIMSYCAKWLGEETVYYSDLRGKVKEEDDSQPLEELWQLLNEADVVIAHNGKKFDCKRINARLIMNGFQPPNRYKVIDTLEIAKRHFGFTSNKLEWLTDKLNIEFKKLKHNRFSGYSLWKETRYDNLEAWRECEEYNIHDVLSLEELYITLAPWSDKHPNYSLYFDEPVQQCSCGSTNWIKAGYAYTGVSKFQRYRCSDCGYQMRGRENLLTKEKRKSILVNIAQ